MTLVFESPQWMQLLRVVAGAAVIWELICLLRGVWRGRGVLTAVLATLASLAAEIEGTPRATISMRPNRQLRRGA